MKTYKVKYEVDGYIGIVHMEAYHSVQASWWTINLLWKFFEQTHHRYNYQLNIILYVFDEDQQKFVNY